MNIHHDVAVIILAAGKGTRMKSDLAKVLHTVAGKSMVCHVVEAAQQVAPDHIHLVVGHQAEQVQQAVGKSHAVTIARQLRLLGTGDAVKSALPGLHKDVNHVLVLCGDVPLIQAGTIEQLISVHLKEGCSVTVLAARVDDPKGYGRILTDSGGRVTAIREEADATEAEKIVNIVNTGIYCFSRTFLDDAIHRIEPDNNQAEYYLTDAVEIAARDNKVIRPVIIGNSTEVMGVNTLEQLALANEKHAGTPDELA